MDSKTESNAESFCTNHNNKQKEDLVSNFNNHVVNCDKRTKKLSGCKEQNSNNSVLERKHSVQSIHQLHKLKPTTYWETLLHMVKGYVGCGAFTTGYTYKTGGMVLTSIILAIIGFISVYNQYILIVMANKFKAKHNMETINFSDTIGIAFDMGPGPFKKIAQLVRKSVKILIITTQIGVCSIYLLFVSQSMEQLLRSYDIMIDLHVLMVYVLPFIWLTALIPEIKYIVPLSTVANISMLSAIVMILYVCISDLEIKSISERTLVADWIHIPLCFSALMYCLEGIGLVLPLQQNMIKPKQFLGPFGILNLSLSFLITLFGIMGFFGYYRFGENVREMLTYNLEAKDNLLTQCIVLFMIIGILCSYAIQFFLPVLLILPTIRRWSARWPYQKYNIYEYIFRSLLVLLTFILAEIVPHLDLITALIGASGGTFLALIYPTLADLCRREKSEYGIFGWRIIIDCLSLILGFCGFVTGTSVTLMEIFVTFKHDFLSSNN